MDPFLERPGDGDPVDVVELGDEPLAVGEVLRVRVLGAIGLIDQGEADWKIVALRVGQDPSSVTPNKIEAVKHWFRTYKVAEGKSENEIAFEGKFLSADFAMKIVMHAHACWGKDLKKSSPP